MSSVEKFIPKKKYANSLWYGNSSVCNLMSITRHKLNTYCFDKRGIDLKTHTNYLNSTYFIIRLSLRYIFLGYPKASIKASFYFPRTHWPPLPVIQNHNEFCQY